MESVKQLPPNEIVFDLMVEGDTTKKMWTGKFKSVCVPTIGQKARASIIEAQLNNDLLNLDEATKIYHRMVSQCQVRILEAPDWWIASSSGQNLLDFNVLYEVWQKCIDAEGKWREKVWGKEEKKEDIKPTIPPVISTSDKESEEPEESKE